MKVLVLGASGFFGYATLPTLSKSFDVVAADLNPRENMVRVDAMDVAQIQTAARGCDAIVNFIIADYMNFTYGVDDQEYADSLIPLNALTAQHVYEAAHREGVKRVIFISSLTVQIGAPRYEMLDPDLPPRPADCYALSKLFGEQCGEMYARQRGLSVICLRLGQPAPGRRVGALGSPLSREWSQLGLALSFDDCARAVVCALRADDISFAAMNIASQGTGSIVQLKQAESIIGYRPHDLLNADGYWQPGAAT